MELSEMRPHDFELAGKAIRLLMDRGMGLELDDNGEVKLRPVAGRESDEDDYDLLKGHEERIAALLENAQDALRQWDEEDQAEKANWVRPNKRIRPLPKKQQRRNNNKRNG